MSSISFEATLNTEKLESSIRSSNATVKDWAQGVERAGSKADQSFSKLDTSLKDSISDQKEYIKGLTKEIKDMEKAFEKVTSGTGKRDVGNELVQAKRRLGEAQGELIGMQKEQIASNTKEADSQEGIIGKLKGWALGLATVGTALKIAKGIIASTDSTTHAFRVVIAEASTGIGYFFKAIASGDWTNFRKGLVDAMNGAREFTNAMESIEDRQNEQTIKSAEASKKIAELRAGTFDRDIENNDKLITNLKGIIDIQKTDYASQAKIAKDTYDITIKNAATSNNINKDRLETLISEFTLNENIIKQGEAYNILQSRLNAARKSQFNTTRITEINAEIAALGEGAAAAGKLAVEYGRVPDELKKSLAALKADQIKLEGLSEIGSKFDERRLATAENLKKTTEADAKKKAIEDAKTENQIKIQMELLNKAVESNNAVEIKAIGERIRKLQEELEVRERIANAAIAASMTRENPLAKITGLRPPTLLPGGLKIPSTLAGVPITSEGDYISGTAMLSDAGKANQKKKDAEYNKDAEDSIEKQIKLHKQMFDEAVRFTYELGKQMDLSEEQQAILGSTLDMFSSLASQDYLGAAASMISGIMEVIPDQAARFQEQIDLINVSLEKQQRLIDLSQRKGGEDKARQQQLDLLNKEKAAIEAQIARDQKKMGASVSWFGSKDKAQADYLKQLEALDKLNIAIDEADQGLSDFLAGGITENTLADSIAQGFRDGKTSVDDFADYMNTVLLDAVMNIFKGQLLSSPQMKEFTDHLKTFMEDQVLTPEEVEQLKRDQLAIVNANKPGFDALTGGLNLGSTGANAGLSGIVRNMSEETGSELAGIIRNQRDDIRQVRDYSKLGIDRLVGIENNTFQTVIQLQLAVIELKNIVSNTKQIPVGSL